MRLRLLPLIYNLKRLTKNMKKPDKQRVENEKRNLGQSK